MKKNMEEHEAIEILKCAIAESEKIMEELRNSKTQAERAGRVGEYYSHLENCEKEIESCEIAIKALEEIQEYRKQGITIEKALAMMCDLAGAESIIEQYQNISNELKDAIQNGTIVIERGSEKLFEIIHSVEKMQK